VSIEYTGDNRESILKMLRSPDIETRELALSIYESMNLIDQRYIENVITNPKERAKYLFTIQAKMYKAKNKRYEDGEDV
jgi:hypothetical protein